jgi:cytochrome b involved in lipid metabolism
MKNKIYIIAILIVLVGVSFILFSLNKNQPKNLEDLNHQNQKTQETDQNGQNTPEIKPNDEIQPTINPKVIPQNSPQPQTQNNSDLNLVKLYTMAEVSQHNSETSCWSVIMGDVYDLTKWINNHPGGPDKILKICGTDGTQAFERKHGGQEKPEMKLTQFKIGKLK